MRGRVLYDIQKGVHKRKHPFISKLLPLLVAPTVLVCALILVNIARAASVSPYSLSGASNKDKTCAALDDIYGGGQTWSEFKIDPPENGTSIEGSLSVTINNLTSTSFDWTSNFGVDAVVVKSGSDGSNLYIYQPSGSESTGDTNLSTPSTQAISHLSFCYDTTPIQQEELANLTLVKNVINDNGGTATETDWILEANGPSSISGVSGSTEVTDAEVEPGTYTLSENSGPEGYTAGTYNCSKNEGDPVESNSITLEAGDFATCIITNDDQPGTLTVNKVVINDNGGTAVADDFFFQVNGGEQTPFSGGQKIVTVDAGIYTVTEPAVAGYDTSYDNCTELVILNGGTATCTITNNDSGGVVLGCTTDTPNCEDPQDPSDPSDPGGSNNTGGQGGVVLAESTLADTGAEIWATVLIGGLLITGSLAMFAFSVIENRKNKN